MALSPQLSSGIRQLVVILSLAMVTAFPEVARAQQGGSEPANAVYVELLGSGGLFSLNYERELLNRISGRIGFASWTAESLFGGNESSYVTVPITMQTRVGSGRHRLELGGGILLGTRSRDDVAGTSGRFTSLSAIVGYRYQPREKGFLFRAVATPFYGFGDDDVAYPEKGLFPSFGISLGYAF